MEMAKMKLGLAKASAPLVKEARPKVEPGTTSGDYYAHVKWMMKVLEDEEVSQVSKFCGKTFMAVLFHYLGATRGGFEKIALQVAEKLAAARDGDKKAKDFLVEAVANADEYVASFDRLMAKMGKVKRAGKVLMTDVVIEFTENRE
jgi:hypothetical protein